MNTRSSLEKLIRKAEQELQGLLEKAEESKKVISGLQKLAAELPEGGNGNGVTAKEVAPLVASLLKQSGPAGTTREIVCAHLKKHFQENEPERALTGIAVQADRALGSEGVEALEGGKFRLRQMVRPATQEKNDG